MFSIVSLFVKLGGAPEVGFDPVKGVKNMGDVLTLGRCITISKHLFIIAPEMLYSIVRELNRRCERI